MCSREGLFIFYLGRAQLLLAPATVFILEYLSTEDKIQLPNLGPISPLPQKDSRHQEPAISFQKKQLTALRHAHGEYN